MPNGVEIVFSVVLCCFNSRDRLQPTLKHLAAQRFQRLRRCELIVVDNNCTDGTGEFAVQVWNDLGAPFPMCLVGEKRMGLTYAREAGVNAASRDHIVFIDDDNWLSDNWLANAADVVSTTPDYGAFGGSIVAEYENAPAPWVLEEESVLACYVEPLLILRELPRGSCIAGAGLVVRKEAYLWARKIFGPWLTVDRFGSSLTGGQDIELCYRLQLLGSKLYRDGRLLMKHFIPTARTSFGYFCKLLRGNAQTEWILAAYRNRLRTTSGSNIMTERLRGNLCVAICICVVRLSKNVLNLTLSSVAGANWRRHTLRILSNCHQLAWLLRHRDEFRKTVERVRRF